MFKSIEYLRYDEIINSYIFKFIDTEFECEVMFVDSAFYVMMEATAMAVAVGAVALEYEKRTYSYQEIVKNLFRCNLYLCNTYKRSFENILMWQHKYIDHCFKEINFSKLYYRHIKDMWDKHKVFM